MELTLKSYVKARKGICMLENWLPRLLPSTSANFCKGLVFVGMHLLKDLKYYNAAAYLSIPSFSI